MKNITIKLTLLVALAASASMMMGSSCKKKVASGPKPNILLVTVSSMRTDRLGVMGQATVPTPAMTRMVNSGALFQNVIVAAPSTRISHASLFTGLYPPQHGLVDERFGRLTSNAETLAERLKGEGYATGAVVGSPAVSRIAGFDQGFDYFDDTLFNLFPEDVNDPKAVIKFEAGAGEVNERAIEWLKQASAAGKPWFLWIEYNDLNAPYDPPTPFDIISKDNLYSGEVGFVDTNFGMLMEELKRLGADGKTLVVLTSDHGEGLDEHGEKNHGGQVYSETTSVFAGFTLPGKIAPGKKISDPVRSTDLFATILEYAGLESDEEYPARSLRRYLDAADDKIEGEWPPAFTVSYQYYGDFLWYPVYSVVSGPLHYIKTDHGELYDVPHDPKEKNNIAEAKSGDAAKMESALNGILDGFKDGPVLKPDPGPSTTAEEEEARALGKKAGKMGFDVKVGDVSGKLDIGKIKQAYLAIESAGAAMAEGKVEEALALLLGITQENPDAVSPYIMVAKIYQSAGKVEEALASYDEYISKVVFPAQKARGLTDESAFLMEAGRTKEAEKLLKEAVKLDQYYPLARLNLGVALLSQDLADDAEREFRRAMELDPGMAAAYYGLGLVYSANAKRRYGAAEMFRKAIDLNPNYAEAYMSMGILLATEPQLLNPELARMHIEKALELNPNVEGAAHGREILEGLGK